MRAFMIAALITSVALHATPLFACPAQKSIKQDTSECHAECSEDRKEASCREKEFQGSDSVRGSLRIDPETIEPPLTRPTRFSRHGRSALVGERLNQERQDF